MKQSENRRARPKRRRSPLVTHHSPLPFVFANFAMTADGKIAFATRQFIPFGSRRDRDHMLELRATADAVMSGARTVDLSAVTLGPGGAKYRRLRLKRGLAEDNLRIIVSGSGSVDPDAEIFRHHPLPRAMEGKNRAATKSTIIVLTTQRAAKSKLKKLRALGAEIKICGKREINFRAAFTWLRKKWQVKRLLCEGGGQLNDALWRAGLMDELHLTICPKIFGGRDAPTLADGTGFRALANAAQLELKSVRAVGDEMFFVFAAKPTV